MFSQELSTIYLIKVVLRNYRLIKYFTGKTKLSPLKSIRIQHLQKSGQHEKLVLSDMILTQKFPSSSLALFL